MEVERAIEERRAYRSLEPVEVDDALVEKLAGAARLSASCFNNQPWRFVFARGETMRRVHGTLSKGNEWATASSMIVGVVSRLDLDCVIKEREYYLFDTGMATAFLILRATELGLVAHPIAGYDEQAAKAALAVPDEMRLITLVIVGQHSDEIGALLTEKQAAEEPRRPSRMPLAEFTFRDRFGEPL